MSNLPVKKNLTRWTEEEDTLLKEIVIENAKKGISKSQTFEDLSELLGRTPAAIGFHYSQYVHPSIKDELNDIKTERIKQGKKLKIRTNKKNKEEIKTENVEKTEVIEIIDKKKVSLESIMQDIQSLTNNEELKEENRQLRARVIELEEKLGQVNDLFESLKRLNL